MRHQYDVNDVEQVNGGWVASGFSWSFFVIPNKYHKYLIGAFITVLRHCKKALKLQDQSFRIAEVTDEGLAMNG